MKVKIKTIFSFNLILIYPMKNYTIVIRFSDLRERNNKYKY